MWAIGLLRRPMRIVGTALGVALAVALLGSLGAFLTTAKRQMTRDAVAQVPVDWQVEVQPGAPTDQVMAALRRRPTVRRAVPVGFASTTGLEAAIGGTDQTTGPGLVLGIPPDYRVTFPTEIRTLAGAEAGVLLSQQTAANLHATPGDTVTVGRAGLPPLQLKVDGVVDLPAADALFQHVGAPPGAQPQAPPDNVILIPLAEWTPAFGAVGTSTNPHTQIHVRLDHRLPDDPSAAFTTATGAANRFEVDMAGAATVGNNLAATLDAARADALYAQVLFLLLGVPGACLAALLTRAVAAASAGTRRRELALFRARGASLHQLQRFVAVEGALVAIIGSAAGVALGALVGRIVFDSPGFGSTRVTSVVWLAASVLAGWLMTLLSVMIPARRDATAASVAFARRTVGRRSTPAVLHYGVDGILLGAATLVFWATSRGQYHLVLAPEGVATVSVNYWALSGPLLLWVGAGLFAWRVVETLLGRGGRFVRAALRPLAGGLSAPAAAILRRQRRPLAAGCVLVALSVSFAISIAVFNATYRAQAEADAFLTNGAPVTVTEAPGAVVSPTDVARVAQVRGVSHVEPLQHRYVYVGADLQDLFGVDATTMARFGHLDDAYFAGGSVRALFQRLAQQPDAALFSAETVKDFQLQPGDALRLRVRQAATGKLLEVPFHYAGVVKEFPTAPTDSFVVANASYVARQTGDAAVSTLLVTTKGASPTAVAHRLVPVVAAGATVSDIDHSRRVIGSSLTAVDLAGLTRLELGYALLLVMGATGLVLGLGLTQRRRMFAIISAIGGRPSQVAAFARCEAAAFAVLGGVLGLAGGWTLAHMLVKVLTGVFDPPPSSLAIPWGYLGIVGSSALVGLSLAVAGQGRALRRPVIELVRDL